MIEMQRLQAATFVTVHTVLALWILTAPRAFAQEQEHPVFDAKGFEGNRAYSGQLPFEHIDTMTGGLVLTHADLVLPGNGGRDLRFQRIYNSKGTAAGRWTFGIAGMVMQVYDAGWPNNPTIPPTFLDSSGKMQRAGLWLNAPHQSYEIALTDGFWAYNRNQRKLFMPDGSVSQFDALGRLTSWSDAFGNLVTAEWLIGNPTMVHIRQYMPNGFPRTVTLYLSEGTALTRMPTSMSFDNKTWTYQLGANGLTHATPPVGRSWQYTYAANGWLARVTTPEGGTVDYQFQTRAILLSGSYLSPGFVTSRTTGGRQITSGTWTYAYTGSTEEYLATNTQVTAPDGVRTVYEYGIVTPGSGNAAAALYPGRKQVLKERTLYDSQNVVREAEQRTYQYVPVMSINASDALPELTQQTITRYGNGGQRTYTTTYTYNAANYGDFHHPSQITESGDLTRTTTRSYLHFVPYWLSGGYATTYVVGLLQSEVTGSGQAFTKSWTYDPEGFRTSETVAGITTTFTPDASGNVASLTKANGKTTWFSYEFGEMSQTSTPEYTVTRQINGDGTVASETRGGRTTTFSYDAVGRLTQIQPPGSTSARVTTYDNFGGTFVRTSRGASFVETTVDGFGRPIATANSVNLRTVIQYDAHGRKTYESYPFEGCCGNGTGTTFQYDYLDRVTHETNPDGTARAHSYSVNGVTLTDESGRVTHQIHKAFGDPDDTRLTRVIDAAGHTWDYDYDTAGALTRVYASDGVVRQWVYNERHLLAQETHPESGTVTYTNYDAAGVLKQKVDAKGTTFQYAHDGNDRLSSITAGTRSTTIAYESGSDNRSAVVVDGVSSAYAYDTAGRLRERTDTIDSFAFITRLAYDANDNISEITYPSGRRVLQYFDSENRLTQVRRQATGEPYATTVNYHPSGAVAGYWAGNVITTLHYDQRYRVTGIVANSALFLTYNYDNVGNVISTYSSPVGSAIYFYDQLDRLVQANTSAGVITRQYDMHGNRQNAGETYGSNKFRPTSYAGLPISFDANGNMTSASQVTYSYTPDNLIQSVNAAGTQTTFAYDSDDWRVKKVSGSTTTYSLRGPNGQLLTEWSITGGTTTTRDYIYIGSRLIAAATAVQP
jgi:YD repeat-containing protein